MANHEQTTSPLFATCQVVKSFIGEAAYVRKVVGAATIGAGGCESRFLPVTKLCSHVYVMQVGRHGNGH